MSVKFQLQLPDRLIITACNEQQAVFMCLFKYKWAAPPLPLSRRGWSLYSLCFSYSVTTNKTYACIWTSCQLKFCIYILNVYSSWIVVIVYPSWIFVIVYPSWIVILVVNWIDWRQKWFHNYNYIYWSNVKAFQSFIKTIKLWFLAINCSLQLYFSLYFLFCSTKESQKGLEQQSPKYTLLLTHTEYLVMQSLSLAQYVRFL